MFDDLDSDDRLWAAVAARDPSADGTFYCCVRTTKVYCRPSCAGRPLRKNVFFVRTRAEAETAGMRACKRCRPDRLIMGGLSDRISAIDWRGVEAELGDVGFARLGRLLSEEECGHLAGLYGACGGFRATVTMGRHGFGAGEYKYFAEPLPALVSELRTGLYARLAPIASAWSRRLGENRPYPPSHADYRGLCASAGQTRPTPLLLSYGPGDYNSLHQDLYGSETFPTQIAILLSMPGRGFGGGEFILTEQRPRMQARAHVVPLEQGDAVAFAVNDRPVDGAKGPYRAKMRHGVATVRRGRRVTLGVIFHDAP